MNTRNHTIPCKRVHAISFVNIVSNDGFSQVASTARIAEPAATFSPTLGVTSS